MTPNRTALIPTLALAAAVLLGACGGDDDTTADGATEETTSEAIDDAGSEPSDAAAGDVVTIAESRFAPDPLEVAAGAEVTFENTDPYAHTVTSAEDSTVEFDSGELGQDDEFTQTFDDAGTYEYFCQIHPTMRAEVVVS